jgi:RNA polymerase sigma factor (sigma-70 family)
VRTDPSDDELLARDDAEAFAAFYSRHHDAVHHFFARRVTHDRAADLTAETFASALVARRRYVPGPTPAAGWLYAIAARRLIDAQRRDLADMRRRESLVASISAGARGASMPIEDELELGLLRHLPLDQRDALRARFGHVP